MNARADIREHQAGSPQVSQSSPDTSRYNPLVLEPAVFNFWKTNTTYEQVKKKNAKGKSFYFLDGPPYTSGKVHIGTAWNKSLKDALLRYKRMQGFNVWDRAGYDMHGLPTEHATEKKLGIKGKEAILKYGVEKFVVECEKLCVENMLIMNEDFKRMGVWMDFDNAYQSIKKEFTEGVWFLIKKAHDQKRLYEGKRTMTWCAHCATSIAKHELEYQTLKEESIFLKFPVEGEKNTFLVIWTTTPWTIPFNLAVMVNPELPYVKAEVEDHENKTGKKKEIWILAKALAGPVIQMVAGKAYKIKEELLGKQLEGVKYLHPLHKEIPFFEEIKDNPKLHTVLLSSEYVNTGSGTGLVHCSPGSGPEDYEVGHRNGLPAFNTLDDHGVFHHVGRFNNHQAKVDDKKCIEILESTGMVVAKTEVEHEYPTCQRCHQPVIFRATAQWFFRVEDLKEKFIKENNKIQWIPDAAYNAFNSWLMNLRDNSITKQRFWGTPIPIWKCDACSHYVVFGTVKEIEREAKTTLTNLHKPWIDKVTFPCKQPKCKGTKRRLPDILDVWIDAGCASWNCLDYPQNTATFKKLYPAEFIIEGKDQIRGWFNLLHIASILGLGKPSFKTCYMHGFVQDAQGRKMSKSLGNYILPEEVIAKYGADTLRYYTIGGANPAVDLNYNFHDMELKYRNLGILWNLHKFIIEYTETIGKNPDELDEKTLLKSLGLEEKYMLSRVHSTVKKVTELYDRYLINEVPQQIEDLYLDLSRTYIHLVREKSAVGDDAEKDAVLYTLFTSFMTILKLFSTIAPFISEQIYQNLRQALGSGGETRGELKTESIHLCSWPAYQQKLITLQLEQDVDSLKQVLQALFGSREKAKLGVRWPLGEVVVATSDKELIAALKRMQQLILNQANAKKLVITNELAGMRQTVRPNYATIKPEFKESVPEIIAQLTIDSPETILSHIRKDGCHKIRAGSKDVLIKEEHLVIENVVPEPYLGSSIKMGVVYINTKRTPELDGEGYVREVMRQIQSLRKTAGLQKTNFIRVSVKMDATFVPFFKQAQDLLREKVGARKCEFTDKDTMQYTERNVFTVKGKEFVIGFERVK